MQIEALACERATIGPPDGVPVRQSGLVAKVLVSNNMDAGLFVVDDTVEARVFRRRRRHH
ncbi:MAG TPA: hypothetical protein VEI01_01950 [Terriglobales bacterium]|nr:hypothetical protein [Terriglobales bacterium]